MGKVENIKKRKLIGGNWKMNLGLSEGEDLLNSLVKREPSLKTVVFPSFLHIEKLNKYSGKGVFVGAQNCSSEPRGAFTGEVSVGMLNELNVKYVLIGHSERRVIFGEDNSVLIKKLRLSLEQKMIPVFCFGENLEEREAGKAFSVIEDQLRSVLTEFSPEEARNIVLAYEPVWAIGTGKTASPDQAAEVHVFCRGIMEDIFGSEIAESCTILYGGSVKPSNAVELFSRLDIDGGLVGGASLKAEDFLGIIEAMESVIKGLK